MKHMHSPSRATSSGTPDGLPESGNAACPAREKNPGISSQGQGLNPRPAPPLEFRAALSQSQPRNPLPRPPEAGPCPSHRCYTSVMNTHSVDTASGS